MHPFIPKLLDVQTTISIPRALMFIVLYMYQLKSQTVPFQLLTSPTSPANFASFPNSLNDAGKCQLFVLYHHLRTIAPTLLPLNVADRL